tara:strand:+ start:1573 stop:1746 length:174 start_codon:yes stop_codon:yes gene_type:complete
MKFGMTLLLFFFSLKNIIKQIAFKMLLNPDQAEVYKKQYDEILHDLVVLLKDAGISD